MPVYNVVGPDGKKFRVNSKEGQTQEDANRYIFGKYYADTPVDAAKVSSLATVIPTPAPQPKPKERSYIPAPSIAEKALQPITSYPEALQRAAAALQGGGGSLQLANLRARDGDSVFDVVLSSIGSSAVYWRI